MEKYLKLLGKYWFIISLVGTVVSTLVTEAYYFIGRMERAEATVATLQAWVSDHDDTLTDHGTQLSILKEDERLREAGLLK
jgi:hypothetical protein